MSVLKVPREIFEMMIGQASALAPVEACGMLAGKGGVVSKFYEMTNADESSTHFTLVPEEQFAVAKDMRVEGIEPVAVYHSHPATGARPSEEDIRLAVMPGATYAILSLAGDEPDLKAFVIDKGNVTKIDIEII